MAEASLTPIFERMSSFEGYHPYTAETFADWSLQAGDEIVMSRGIERHAAPVHVATMVWRGSPQLKIETTGQKERDPIAKMSQKKYNRGGSGVRNAHEIYMFYYDMYDESGMLHATVFATAESLTSAFTAADNSVRSYVVQTAQSLTAAFDDDIASLHGEVVATAASLTSAFTAADSSIRSFVLQTASSLTVQFDDDIASLHSEIVTTASELTVAFDNEISGLHSEIQDTAASLTIAFNNEISGLHGEIITTAESLTAAFDNEISGLHGEIITTAESLTAAFDNEISGLHGEIITTAESLTAAFDNEISGLHGEIIATAESLTTAFDNEISGLHGEIVTTAESLTAAFDNEISGLHSEIVTTASELTVAFDNEISGLHSEIVNTASDLMIAFDNEVSDLHGEILTTAQSLTTAFNAADNSIRSFVIQTASSLTVSFENADASLRSRIVTTAASLTSAFEDADNSLRSTINQTASRVDIVVDHNGEVQASVIVDAVNNAGGSVIIHADHIQLDGDTTLSGMFQIDNGHLVVRSDAYISGDIWATGDAHVDNVSLQPGGGVSFTAGTAPPVTYTLTGSILSGMIKSASVSGNVLTLTQFNGTDINFSKATTQSGSWGGGVLTVAAQQNNVTVDSFTMGFSSYGTHKMDMEIVLYGGATKNESIPYTIDVPIHLNRLTGAYSEPANVYSKTIPVSITGLLQTATFDTDGTYTPEEGYVGFRSVTVEGVATMDTLTVTENGTYTPTAPISGFNEVIVNVPVSQPDTLYPDWDDNVFTVRAEPSGGSVSTTITMDLTGAGTDNFTAIAQQSGVGSTSTVNRINVYLKEDVNSKRVNACRTSSGTGVVGYVSTANTFAAGETAGKNAVLINKGPWSSGVINFTKSEGSADTKTVRLSAAAPTWSGTTASVVIWDGTAADASHGVQTGYVVTVPAATQINNATYAGKNSVTISGTYTWATPPASGITVTQNTLTVSTTGRTDTSGTASEYTRPINFYSSVTAWDSSNKCYVYITHTNSNAANRIIRREVNAGTLVSNATTAGQNAVEIVKEAWSNGIIQFTKSVGTASTKTVQLVAAKETWSGNVASVKIWDGTSASSGSGVQTGYTVTVDAGTKVTNATYAGKNSVTISGTYTWATKPASGITVTQNTLTVSTTGRTDTSGATEEYTRPINFYSNVSTWDSSNKCYVYITHTNSNASNRIIRREVDGATPYYKGKNSVTISTTYTWTTKPASGITATQNAVTLSTTGRTDTSGTAAEDTETVSLYSNVTTWNSSNKCYVYVTHTSSAEANRIIRREVDGATPYYKGKNSVTISGTYTWATQPASGITVTQNTLTVSTTGRTDTSGMASEYTKPINFYSNVTAWNDANKCYVYITHTNSTEANRIIRREVDGASVLTKGKNAIGLKAFTWSTSPSSSISVDNNTLTASTNGKPTETTLPIKLYLVQGSWDSNNKMYVYGTHTNNTSTGYRFARTQVDGSSILYKGKYSVTISSAFTFATAPSSSITASSNKINMTTTGRTNTSGTTTEYTRGINLYSQVTAWNDSNKCYVYITHTNSTDANRIIRAEVDGYDVYVVGLNAVEIKKGTWSGGKISFTKSKGYGAEGKVQLVAAEPTWSGNTASVVIWDGTSATTSGGVKTGYTVTVNAQERYDAGVSAGYAYTGITATWNNNTFTYAKEQNASGNGGSFTIKSEFYVDTSASTWKYYIRSTRDGTGISGTAIQYKLYKDGATIRLATPSNSIIANTPFITLQSHSQCASGLTRLNSEADGAMMLKDRNGRTVAGGGSYFWYYRSTSMNVTTYYS